MDIVFITHNQLGLACLEELSIAGANVQAIYTRPKREEIADQVGVESFAESRDIPLHRVGSVNSDVISSEIATYNPELLFLSDGHNLSTQEYLTSHRSLRLECTPHLSLVVAVGHRSLGR